MMFNVIVIDSNVLITNEKDELEISREQFDLFKDVLATKQKELTSIRNKIKQGKNITPDDLKRLGNFDGEDLDRLSPLFSDDTFDEAYKIAPLHSMSKDDEEAAKLQAQTAEETRRSILHKFSPENIAIDREGKAHLLDMSSLYGASQVEQLLKLEIRPLIDKVPAPIIHKTIEFHRPENIRAAMDRIQAEKINVFPVLHRGHYTLLISYPGKDGKIAFSYSNSLPQQDYPLENEVEAIIREQLEDRAGEFSKANQFCILQRQSEPM